VALRTDTENVQLKHPLLANGALVTLFKHGNGGLFVTESSILGSEKTLNNVKCLLHSQPSSEIIRTTADYFFVPYFRVPSSSHT
jgi:hypothetical protein